MKSSRWWIGGDSCLSGGDWQEESVSVPGLVGCELLGGRVSGWSQGNSHSGAGQQAGQQTSKAQPKTKGADGRQLAASKPIEQQ
jgi:hypothetical protein